MGHKLKIHVTRINEGQHDAPSFDAEVDHVRIDESGHLYIHTGKSMQGLSLGSWGSISITHVHVEDDK